MYCKNCGAEIPQNFAGNKCPSCGAEIQAENKYIGLRILSFIFPWIGFILYFMNRKDNADKASKILTASWIGVAVNLICMVIEAML